MKQITQLFLEGESPTLTSKPLATYNIADVFFVLYFIVDIMLKKRYKQLFMGVLLKRMFLKISLNLRENACAGSWAVAKLLIALSRK